MYRIFFPLILVSGLFACAEKNAGIDTSSDDTPYEDPTPEDTDEDTGSGYFEPAAVGFAFYGGWDGADLLLPYNIDGQLNDEFVTATLADSDYFGLSGDEKDGHYCTLYMYYNWEAGSFSAEGYEDGQPITMDASFEGTLTLFATGIDQDDTCFNIDPSILSDDNGDGYPFDVFEGMRFGLGFAELTDYSSSLWSKETMDTHGDYMMAAVNAINHPTGDGGVDFIGYDWGSLILWEWDDAAAGPYFDEKGSLVGQSVSDITFNVNSFVQTYPYWYEDFPNLDLDLLR